ncbi:hypothetical protein L873DRAFT_976744 [Choiromyces venosus 120613-1]|uniref:Uncharacterized protein n=1 Tax=Choiromyces venosus 120613-1 TaxID=1336337 RepID=A0A3N4JQJ5_9PEZI|nr:hypothetical protein L873DRAFT_976744 [Choiromyces venosus 120613-1]
MLGIHVMSYRLLANGHIHTSKVTPITIPHCVINVLTIPHLYRLCCYDETGNQNLARRHEYWYVYTIRNGRNVHHSKNVQFSTHRYGGNTTKIIPFSLSLEKV